MKIHYALAAATIVGFGLGAIAIDRLHAQAKPPVYVVIDISDITDAEGFKAVGQRSNAAGAAVFKEQGGRYIARTQNITALDGTPPKRMIIIAFDSVDKAQAWNNSPAQKEVNAIRGKTTKSRSFIVEGM